MIDIFQPRIACNSYLFWKDKKHAILVDPGYNINNSLIEHINKLGLTIEAVLITHAHYDHIDGLEAVVNEFPNVVSYVYEKECPDIDNPKFNLSGWSEWGNQNLIYRPKNIVELMDGETFEVGGYTIKCIATPFHTHGSACYLVDEENALFSGDTLFYTTVGRTDLASSTPRTMSASLLKLVALEKDYDVYPGHGPKTHLDREKKYNSYLRNI